jgi:putative flippase GtrA
MLKNLWEHKKVRFACAGTLNAVVDLTILNALVFKFNFPVWLGNAIAVSVAITMSYFLNHRVVFRHHHNPSAKQYLKFFLVTGVGIIITQTLIIYITRATYDSLLHSQIPTLSNNIDDELSLNLAKVSAAMIGIVWNYLFYSRVIFKKTPELPVDEDTLTTV